MVKNMLFWHFAFTIQISHRRHCTPLLLSSSSKVSAGFCWAIILVSLTLLVLI